MNIESAFSIFEFPEEINSKDDKIQYLINRIKEIISHIKNNKGVQSATFGLNLKQVHKLLGILTNYKNKDFKKSKKNPVYKQLFKR